MANFTLNGYSEQSQRPAAVAGSFYPADPVALRSEVEAGFRSAVIASKATPRLLISPHAGYVFSGAIAAKGFAHLNESVKRVILIGPSHYQAFSGVAYPEVSWYETPLGKVKIDENVVKQISVQNYARPASGADVQEHCLEVQLPFLQVKLADFTIVPLLTGRIRPPDLAEMLFPFIDESTIVVASSDLSHYHVQKDARKIDDLTVSTILDNDTKGNIDGCGEVAIRTVMLLAQRLQLKPVVIDSKTSFETAPAHCPESRVVGYASIIYFSNVSFQQPDIPKIVQGVSPAFSARNQLWMLRLARESLVAAVYNSATPQPKDIPLELKEARGCFITLTKNKNLRGCIGYIEPIKPLYQAIVENARNAALNDPRFSPVHADEMKDITLEISILTKPTPLIYENADDLLNRLRCGVDGVILSKGHRQSTFLPQVWEQLPRKIDFLEHLAMKAGMERADWKTAEFKIYTAEHFQENNQ